MIFCSDTESAEVHCPQNFIPAGFSKPHLEQRIGSPPASRRPMREYRRNTDQRKQTRYADRATKGRSFTKLRGVRADPLCPRSRTSNDAGWPSLAMDRRPPPVA
jgi:hypothetical protein